MQPPGPLPSPEVTNPKRSDPALTELLWVTSVTSTSSSPATRQLLRCLCPKVFRTKRCAGRCRYARMASMLKKLTSQDLERYFKKWFLKHFQLNRVGGLIAHDGGRGEQAGDTGSVVSTEASPLGEVRMVCCRKGATFQDFKGFASRRPEWGGEAGRRAEASLYPWNWIGTFVVWQSILGEKVWHSRGPVPRSQFKGALRLLICKMQAYPNPYPRGRLCHERAWSRHSRVTRVPGLTRWT